MLTIFHSPKGGSGTTVTAASFALATAAHHGKAMFIDMCGDARAVLGLADVGRIVGVLVRGSCFE